MPEIATIPQPPQTFIATTPAEMERAQAGMIQWCDQRIESEKLEIADLERTISEAQRANIRDHAWKTRLRMARAKVAFYRKTKAALLKGYYIVPPLPVQLFAIRTAVVRPKGLRTNARWDYEQQPAHLPEGEGEWHSPFPSIRTGQEAVKQPHDGKEVTRQWWAPEHWLRVDFPFKLVRPEIISAVAGAIEDKIFDALGILPEYRTSDPIVLGQILPPHRKYPQDRLHFFVAWWLDVGKM